MTCTQPLLTAHKLEYFASRVYGATGIWADLDFTCPERFAETLFNSVFIGEYPFGYFRIEQGWPEHVGKLHAVIWHKSAYANLSTIANDIAEAQRLVGFERLECTVPTTQRSLNRLLPRVGLVLEGTLHSVYKVKGIFYDGNIYSRLRR